MILKKKKFHVLLLYLLGAGPKRLKKIKKEKTWFLFCEGNLSFVYVNRKNG